MAGAASQEEVGRPVYIVATQTDTQGSDAPTWSDLIDASVEGQAAGYRLGYAAALRDTADELDEMFALVRSRVELSVERLLASVERSGRHR